MTWSIIARDEQTSRVGIIVASRSFAVGSLSPHIKTGTGAVMVQGLVNPFVGPQGLALLQAGASAEDAVRFLTSADEGRDHRQFHLMDRRGSFAAHTGSACNGWCGHIVRATFSLAGDTLVGPRVLDATAAAYDAARTVPFARRMIGALVAGEAAGGSRLGRQSAALLIHDDQEYPLLDLRVDSHPDPLAELARLEVRSRERFLHLRRFLPSSRSPSGIADQEELGTLIAASIAEGYE